MKKRALVGVAALSVCSAFAEMLIADPSVVREGDRYCLVGTGPSVTGPSGLVAFPLYVSSDLTDWKLAETVDGTGRILAQKDAFGKANFWAPQLFTRGGKWYFAYTCDYSWGIATAARPEGPFRTIMKCPLKGFAIDPFVFQDDDGRVYDYFSRGGIQGVELKPTLDAWIGEPVKCVVNDQPWEKIPLEKRCEDLNKKFGYKGWDEYHASAGTIEGPTVVKRRGKYVLFYSANDFRSPDYCIGAAVADSPLGPWKKLQNAAVLSREHTGFNGTGHGDLFTKPDGSLWYVFHAHNSSIRISPRRTGAIRLTETVGEDGYPRYVADVKSMTLF